MLTPLDDKRHPIADIKLAIALAACAGAANAVALRASGVFAANMTGNVSWVSDHIESGMWRMALFVAAVITLFISGSFSCALLSAWGRRRLWHTIYADCLLAEALGLAAFSVIHTPAVLCCGLTFLMGWQNSLATTLTGARVRATHLSGICTDVGIELSHLCMAVSPSIDPSGPVRRHRIVLGVTTIGAFGVGAFLGCVAFRHIAERSLLAVSCILGGLAALGYRATPQPRAGN